MSSINKLKNTWVSNDTTNLDGTYGKVSILNEGKSELKGDTLINSKLAVNKNIDSNNDYKLDVNGNINFTGSLYQNNALFTSGISQAFADGRYGQLSSANTFTAQNTFSNGILPCRTGSTSDIQIGGNNQLQYRQSTSANNISIGDLALQGDSTAGWTQYNTGKRNIAIGESSLQRLDLGNDNIFMGYQAGQNCGSARLHGVGITPQRCIAIGTFSQLGNLYMADSISIGYNSLRNASGPAAGNIMMGSNVGNGLNFQGNCTFIGTNCAPTVNDNAITAIGYQALGAATGQFNSGTAIGWQAGYNNNNGQGGTFIGAEAGFTNTSGSNNTCIGLKAGRPSQATVNNTICIGFNSGAQINNECVFGGEASSEQVLLTLPGKHRLSCNQSPLGITINLAFRTNENVLITDNNITTFNLPTPNASGVNQGAKFNLIRLTSTTNITINAPSGHSIGFFNANGVYGTASSYGFSNTLNNVSLLCVGNSGSSWIVINQLFLTTNITSNLTANSLTVTPTELSQLNGITSNIQTQLNSKLGTTITQNLTANSLIITPTELSQLNGITSNIQTQLNSKLGTTITQNLTANSLTITPEQLCFLNRVLKSPSANATLIPKTAIANLSDFLQYNINQTITATYTFQTNPIFNNNSISSLSIENYNNYRFLELGQDADITGVLSFLTNPIFNTGAIPSSAISDINNYQLVSEMTNYLTTATASTTYQTIAGMTSYANINGLNKLGGSYATVGGSVGLSFGDNQYLILEGSPIVTNIALPNPTTTSNIGARFSIINRVGNVANRNVTVAAGTFIWDFNSNTTTASFSMNNIGIAEFICVGLSSTNSTTYVVCNRDDNVLKNGNQTIGGVKTFSSAPVMSGASITAGTIPSNCINYTTYIPFSVSTLSASATSLTSPYSNYYIFTSATADTVITLPTITTALIGCPLTFRRSGNTSFQLIVKTASGSNTTIVQRASITETAQNTNYTLLATNQFVMNIVAISLTKWSVVQ